MPPERIIDTARALTRAAIPAPEPEPGRFVNGIPVSRFYDEPPTEPSAYMAARRDADQTGTRRRKPKQARSTRWQSQETPE